MNSIRKFEKIMKIDWLPGIWTSIEQRAMKIEWQIDSDENKNLTNNSELEIKSSSVFRQIFIIVIMLLLLLLLYYASLNKALTSQLELIPNTKKKKKREGKQILKFSGFTNKQREFRARKNCFFPVRLLK